MQSFNIYNVIGVHFYYLLAEYVGVVKGMCTVHGSAFSINKQEIL